MTRPATRPTSVRNRHITDIGGPRAMDPSQ